MFPVLHLDHIYYDGQVEVVKLELPRTRLSLMASDHLPLVAELKVQFSSVDGAGRSKGADRSALTAGCQPAL